MDSSTDFTRYAESVRDELLDFLRAFAPIPAPSHNEDRRVAFLLDALPKMGKSACDGLFCYARNVFQQDFSALPPSFSALMDSRETCFLS